MARKAGVETITAFFTHELAKKVVEERGRADVVTVTQVLQHIRDVTQLVEDVGMMLKPGGVFVIEGRYFADTVRKASYDTVYHEMLYFFTLTSLRNLLSQVGMEVFRAELSEVYGGSLRVYAKKAKTGKIRTEPSVREVLASERAMGLDRFETYAGFAKRAFELRDELRRVVQDLRAKGSIAG